MFRFINRIQHDFSAIFKYVNARGRLLVDALLSIVRKNKRKSRAIGNLEIDVYI